MIHHQQEKSNAFRVFRETTNGKHSGKLKVVDSLMYGKD